MVERLDLADLRLAPSGEGQYAATWSDKPHRLLYDACSELTAAHRHIEELTRALEDVRAAIMEADPAVLIDTLWMPERLSPAETVVDHIDAILASKQGGEL